MSPSGLADAALIVMSVSIFSGIGMLVFLGMRSFVPDIDWNAHISKFLFSVFSGVATYYLTYLLFGYGVEDASVTGIATALVIGSINKMVGIG